MSRHFLHIKAVLHSHNIALLCSKHLYKFHCNHLNHMPIQNSSKISHMQKHSPHLGGNLAPHDIYHHSNNKEENNSLRSQQLNQAGISIEYHDKEYIRLKIDRLVLNSLSKAVHRKFAHHTKPNCLHSKHLDLEADLDVNRNLRRHNRTLRNLNKYC